MKKYLFIIYFAFIANNLFGQSLLIYGGKNQDIFLGCLNFDKFEDKSIWNKFGNNGSKFNDKCIWNKFGEYGGKFSDFSPFNKFASKPPILVDKYGNFYGYFTADKYFTKRTTSKLALLIIDYWEEIFDNIDGYYEKIFK